jgi:hypothetical protein
MRHRTQSQLCLPAAVLMTLLVVAPHSDVAHAADPDFTNVTDILGGQRHLLRDDDLIVFHNFCGFSCTPSSFVLQTSDSTITQAVRSDAPWEPPLGGSVPGLDTALAVGHMFDLPNDMVAAVGTQDNNGTLSLSYYIYDPVQGTNVSGTVPTGLPYGDVDFVGMADFTGDGYADLIVHNIAGGLRVASPKDVTDMSAGLTWGGRYKRSRHLIALISMRYVTASR